MTISRSSWHYRLLLNAVHFYDWGLEACLPRRWRSGLEPPEPMPRNLCRYFWSLIAVFVALPLFLVAAPIIFLIAYTAFAVKTVTRKVRARRGLGPKPE